MHTLFAGGSQNLKTVSASLSPRFPVKGLFSTPPLRFLFLHPHPEVDSFEKSSVDWRKQETEITDTEEEDTKNRMKSHMEPAEGYKQIHGAEEPHESLQI